MRRRRNDGPSLRGPIACCLLAVVALSLGPSAEAKVRAAVRDAARPGYLMARALRSLESKIDLARWPWSGGPPVAAPLPKPRAADPTAEAELRRLRIELATARRRLSEYETSLGPVRVATASEKRPTVERVPAHVLDASDASVGPGGLVIQAGAVQGVGNDQPAVAGVTLAAGESDGVAGDELILAGAAVVGRTGEVGAWTSKIVPVTSETFRAHVRIVRETAEGPAFGEDGLLEGDGRDRCIVKYVPSTAAVSVGDHIYSHDASGRIPQPLYFGRIESASLRDGAPHWDIRVRPAADVRNATEVHVLCPQTPAPLQTAANEPK